MGVRLLVVLGGYAATAAALAATRIQPTAGAGDFATEVVVLSILAAYWLA